MSTGFHDGGDGANTYGPGDVARVRTALRDALEHNLGDCINVNPSTFAGRIGTGLAPNRLSALLRDWAAGEIESDGLAVTRVNPGARRARYLVREAADE